jgi:hypothetical protein
MKSSRRHSIKFEVSLINPEVLKKKTPLGLLEVSEVGEGRRNCEDGGGEPHTDCIGAY